MANFETIEVTTDLLILGGGMACVRRGRGGRLLGEKEQRQSDAGG